LEIRKVNRSRFLFFVILVALSSLFLAGCPFSLSLPDDIVKIHMDECPDWDTDELSRKARDFGHDTTTRLLECALGTLRDAMPAPIHRTAAVARICFLLADREVKDEERKENLASEGVRWAEIAISEGAGLDGAVHYYLAMNLGLAVYEHSALAVKNLKRLASELRKACQLAPNEDQGGPYRVLGMLYLMAPPWPEGIGDGDKALELLAEVVEHHPEHPLNHSFYALALWDLEEEDALDQVESHLLTAVELLREPKWDLARERYMKDIRELAEDAEIDLGVEPRKTE
jgi:hypothetical protein